MANARRERPAETRSPTASRFSEDLVLGIDLGATKVVSGLISPDGTIVHQGGRHLHANDGPAGVLRSLLESVDKCRADAPEYRPNRAGVAVAAQVDPRDGTVIHAPNLGWRDFPLAQKLSESLDGVPVVVLNDARAATLAEWRLGVGRESADFFCMILGTGVGGSAVVGGRLLEGGAHALGEVGHLTVVSGGRKCRCPNSGCLEAYVGGWAIAERAQEAVRADPAKGAGLVRRAGSAEAITARTVFEAYRSSDPLGVLLVRETERFLADGAVSISNAFNPSVIAIGGGLVSGMPEFLSVIQDAIRSRCQPPAAGAHVMLARFGEDAPLVGAAVAARIASAHRA